MIIWGQYFNRLESAEANYIERIHDFIGDSGTTEKTGYRYYSTQRPISIGTFPKTENDPVHIVNFDMRETVEPEQFRDRKSVV